MPPISGSVRVAGFIAPTDSTDVYPVTDDIYNKGGFRPVANAAGRIAITAERRKIGMLVYQLDTGKFWQLIGGIADINWTLVTIGGGGGIDPDPAVWVTNRVETEMFTGLPVGPGLYHSGNLYVNYIAGTLLMIQAPYQLMRVNVPAAAKPIMMFGREMNGSIMDWVAEGFGIGADGTMTPANFLHASFVIGWQDFGDIVEDLNDYIVFEKKVGDNTLWASISTATGPDHFSVDTGLLWVQDEVHKYEILIDPVLFTADFYQDDIGDVVWPDSAPRPWKFYAPGDLSEIEYPILYQFPWFVSMHK